LGVGTKGKFGNNIGCHIKNTIKVKRVSLVSKLIPGERSGARFRYQNKDRAAPAATSFGIKLKDRLTWPGEKLVSEKTYFPLVSEGNKSKPSTQNNLR
jgi:hypothetical protein